jgi:hypothetical protein
MTNLNLKNSSKQKTMIKIINNVKLLKVNKNEILDLNSILNENFSEILLYIKEQLKSIKFKSETIIYVNGTTDNYSFMVKHEDQKTINLIESIIEKVTK